MQLNHSYTQIDLLRHGVLATSGLFCAHANEPLSDKGMQQLMKATHANTQSSQWDVILSSPHRRCRDFAHLLATQHNTELHVEDAFKEMDFGRWVGMSYETVWKQDSHLLKQLWQSPESFTAPDGEPMKTFVKRVQQAWNILLKHYRHQSILLITHAGVVRVVLAEALNIPYANTQTFNIDYAQFTRLNYYSNSDDSYSNGNYSLVGHGLQRLPEK